MTIDFERPPFLVPDGYTRSAILWHPGPRQHRLLFYPNGEVRFEHLCDRGDRGVIICAPALRLNDGHRVTDDRPGHVTVTPSILCPDCGTHGFATDGKWVE